MSLEAIYFISQIVSALAIVASLIFVALQMRQADRTQRAMMHQLRAQRGMDMALRMMDADAANAWFSVNTTQESATTTDVFKIANLQRAMVQNLADTVLQHKAGLLDQATYDSTIVPLRIMFSNPSWRALWLVTSAGYGETHVKMVNELLVDGQALNPPMDFMPSWRALANQLRDKITS